MVPEYAHRCSSNINISTTIFVRVELIPRAPCIARTSVDSTDTDGNFSDTGDESIDQFAIKGCSPECAKSAMHLSMMDKASWGYVAPTTQGGKSLAVQERCLYVDTHRDLRGGTGFFGKMTSTAEIILLLRIWLC